MSFAAHVIAAVCFALAWAEVDIAHLVDAGLFFAALGLALAAAPPIRRGP